MPSSIVLPQDILLLLCQELASRTDFSTLFRLSLASRRVASIALEHLYRIFELSPASYGESGKLAWARLWRSIILSSVGGTVYPYCAHVQTLSLGQDFVENMPDCLNDPALRDYFFSGPMAQFLVLVDGVTPATGLPRIDAEKTMVKCAESVTSFIKNLADDTGTVVSLAHLEFYNIPIDLLPTWISRLGTLRSLRIRDGSILGAEAASAIARCCNNFDELTLYFLDGPTVDEDLAAFFNTLRPNTLRSFQVMSQNRVGQHTLNALNNHASSLKSLRLGTLSAQAMKSLNTLSKCTAMEVLEIENDGSSQADLQEFDEDVLKEITVWIQSCKSLRDLTLTGVRDSLTILKDVLMTPGIRLTSLDVKFLRQFDPRESHATWDALKLQHKLESFTLGANLDQQELFILAEYPNLVDAICSLNKLKSLNLKQTFAQAREIERLIASLPHLIDFGFGGELVTDTILEPLAALPNLATVSISAQSEFTVAGLRRFARAIESRGRPGFQCEILGQVGHLKLSQRDRRELQNFFADRLYGRFDIGYHMDPDELHEDDFSDLSD